MKSSKLHYLTKLQATPKNQFMQNLTNHLLFRMAALLLHGFANFIVISVFMDYDVTGSWLRFFAFILACTMLGILFFMHVFSFIRFVKKSSDL